MNDTATNPVGRGLNAPAGVREATLIVAYDLPSENRVSIPDGELKAKVRATRIACVEALHSLGLGATESVIVVPPSRREDVERVVEAVRRRYVDLEAWLRERGLSERLEPVIEVMEQTPQQSQSWARLAAARLRERLDDSIDRVARLLDEIDGITEEARRRRIRYNLRELRREWLSIADMARALGIDLGRDYRYLLQLIDEAEGRV